MQNSAKQFVRNLLLAAFLVTLCGGTVQPQDSVPPKAPGDAHSVARHGDDRRLDRGSVVQAVALAQGFTQTASTKHAIIA
jgi:hypothetical protein